MKTWPVSSRLRICLQMVLFVLCFAMPFDVLARLDDDDTAALQECTSSDFINALATRESSNNYGNAKNKFGYMGRYQMGESAMNAAGFYTEPTREGMNEKYQKWNGSFTGLANSYGVRNIGDFLNNPAAQDAAYMAYTKKNFDDVSKRMASDPVFNKIVTNNGWSMSSLVAGCHLKGCAGLSQCLKGLGSCTDGGSPPTDVHDYLKQFNGYDLPWSEDGGGCSNEPYSGPPRSETNNGLCDPDIRAQIINLSQARMTMKSEFMRKNMKPPASIQQVAGPCVSRELDRITNQFSSGLANMVNVNANFGSGPVGGIMNNFFKAGYESLNKAAAFLPTMLNFQSQASNALGGLLQSLGGSDAFSSQLCGMMTDMILKYIQCEAPMQLPKFDLSIDVNLDSIFPGGCAGEAAKSAIYGAASQFGKTPIGQTVTKP